MLGYHTITSKFRKSTQSYTFVRTTSGCVGYVVKSTWNDNAGQWYHVIIPVSKIGGSYIHHPNHKFNAWDDEIARRTQVEV